MTKPLPLEKDSIVRTPYGRAKITYVDDDDYYGYIYIDDQGRETCEGGYAHRSRLRKLPDRRKEK